MNRLFKNTWKVLLLSALVLSGAVSCSENEAPTFKTGGVAKIPDSYLQILTPVVSFQAGNEKYGITFNAIMGEKVPGRVDVYASYTDAASATGLTSEEVLLTSYEISGDLKDYVTDSLTYEDLKEGITIDGDPLPESDLDLAVGARWSLRLVGVYSDNEEEDFGTITVAVLSPYAGLYEVVDGAYYRIGVIQGSWTGSIRFIGSVDENTFSHEYVGLLGPSTGFADATWEFDLDVETFVLTVPADPADPLLGDEQRNCVDNSGAFTNVSCAGSNILVPDPVGGRHRIFLTYGYAIVTGDPAGQGVREFYEELVKVVD